MSASDKQLIDAVANLWVEMGGDAEGVTFCWHELRRRVEEIIKENEKEGAK
jgi:hypothetical protein